MKRFSKVLVPVDFSDHSNAALEVAVEIAKVCDAKITLLHCYQICAPRQRRGANPARGAVSGPAVKTPAPGGVTSGE